jgi:hypothetical protein
MGVMLIFSFNSGKETEQCFMNLVYIYVRTRSLIRLMYFKNTSFAKSSQFFHGASRRDEGNGVGGTYLYCEEG